MAWNYKNGTVYNSPVEQKLINEETNNEKKRRPYRPNTGTYRDYGAEIDELLNEIMILKSEIAHLRDRVKVLDAYEA